MFALMTDPTIGECEIPLSDLTPAVWISAVDQITRAIGHCDDYETDEMGSAASVLALTDSERVAYAMASSADWQHSRNHDAQIMATLRGSDPLPDLVVKLDADDLPGPFAYVRSDDHGFWAVDFGSESDCREYLADWVAANVPPHCTDCGEMVDADGDVDPGGLQSFCSDCNRRLEEAAHMADHKLGRVDPDEDRMDGCPECVPGGLLDELRQAETWADADGSNE